MDKKFSNDMHAYTEKIGDFLPIDAHHIIKHRYLVAEFLSKGKKVLEVGVGQEFGMQTIAKSARQYIGIEYSEENVLYLNQVQSNYKIIHGDAHAMPFSNSEFEIVNALAMIYYLELKKFLHEVRRVLVPEGCLFFCTSNRDAPGFIKPPFTKNYYSIPDLNKIIEEQGFEADFYGSFARYKKNESKKFAQFKVFIKNIFKSIIKILPFGENLWTIMRNKHLGGSKKLPHDIKDIAMNNTWNDDFHALEKNIINNQYRVIYCIAKLKNKN